MSSDSGGFCVFMYTRRLTADLRLSGNEEKTFDLRNVNVTCLYCIWLQVEFCSALCETRGWFCRFECVTRAPLVRTEEQMDEISAPGEQCRRGSSTVLSSFTHCWRNRLQKLPLQLSCAFVTLDLRFKKTNPRSVPGVSSPRRLGPLCLLPLHRL